MTGFLNTRIPQGARNTGAVLGSFGEAAPYVPIYPLSLQNGDAETGDMSGWTLSAGIYAPENVSTASGATSAQGGTRFFRGSNSNSIVSGPESAMWQNISIDTTEVNDVDDGNLFIDYSFYQEAISSIEDDVEIIITFFNVANVQIGIPYRRLFDAFTANAAWTLRSVIGVQIPPTCRYFQFKINFKASPTTTGVVSRGAYVDTIVVSKVTRPAEIQVLNSRLYAILGPQPQGVTVRNTRLYAILGPQPDGVTVRNSRLYAIIQP